MKKNVCFLLACILMSACSKDEIPLIPMEKMEESFRNYLLENFDLDKDGFINEEEAALVTEINVYGRNILSYEGIEYFPNLEIFICANNSAIYAIDLKQNPKLKMLNCSFSSHINSIDVSHNPKLKILDCGFCNIQELDVSNNHELDTLLIMHHNFNVLKSLKINPELTCLDMRGHGFAVLDFSGNQHLKELICHGDNLVHLDVSRSVLEALSCGSPSKLASINVEGCTKLKKITCSGGNVYEKPVLSLNLTDCRDLEELYASSVNSLNVNHCPLLKILDCYSTNLANLDLTNNPALTDLRISGYYSTLESIAFANNSQLTNIEIDGCEISKNFNLDLSNSKTLKSVLITVRPGSRSITDVNLSGCTSLEKVAIADVVMKSLKITGCTALLSLHCSSNQLTTLDFEGCSNLVSLYCNGNSLTELDVSECSKLTELNCSNNSLTLLKTSVENLSIIDCSINGLTEINVSNHSKLKELRCMQTKITSLDLSGCFSLENLFCNNNNLSGSLNIKDCKSLKKLVCQNCLLTSLDISYCVGLTSLDCSRNNLQPSLDISKNTVLSSLDCRYNNLKELIVNRNSSIQTLQKDSETQIVLVD
jgi:hypothetical protein